MTLSTHVRLTVAATFYNEEGNISSLEQMYKAFCQVDPEIQFVFVDNNSADNTYNRLVTSFGSCENVILLSNRKSAGYGDGVRSALSVIHEGYVLLFPGDFQFSIDELLRFLTYWKTNCQSQHHMSVLTQRIRQDGVYAALRGKVWRLLVCKMFQIPGRFDPASQLKILCVDCIPSCTETTFTYDIELAYKLTSKVSKVKLETFRVKFSPRIDGKSSIHRGIIKTELHVLISAMQLRKKIKKKI